MRLAMIAWVSISTIVWASSTFVHGFDETISDIATGLQWKVGPDTDSDLQDALEWTSNLQGTWRLPSADELRTLSAAGISSENWELFLNQGTAVWSCESTGQDSTWCFDFNLGFGYSASNYTASSMRVFAVRSPLTSTQTITTPRFVRSYEGVITDSETGLLWCVGPEEPYISWFDAYSWVQSLGRDWSMPTREQLEVLFAAGLRGQEDWGIFSGDPWSGWWVWTGETASSSTVWVFSFGETTDRTWTTSPDFGEIAYAFGRALAVSTQ